MASPPARVHYVATFTNVGTGTARAGCAACQLSLSLPAEFRYVAGTAGIDGTAVADPTVTGRVLSFTSGLSDIPPGATLTLEVDVDLAAGVPPGAYTIAIESWFQAGRQINDARAGLAEVLVGILRSDPPFVRPPLLSGITTVTGTSSEASGSTIRVLANGILVGSATVDSAGSWSVRVPPLFAGQNITATAEAVGELESRESSPPVVVRAVNLIPDCSDGTDNDGDTLVDFPDDPGCADGDDIDETDVPECSDGLDNDLDGEVDFPSDLSCSSFRDGAEGGPPECSDGVDNDGNLLVDMGDPGCSSSDDPTETTLPACSDGLDNDDDLKIDYPFDPGCFSALERQSG
ncbi:MAG: hypothetical protein HYV07_14700 [Deltaproteobacteria bacterium]|nr:hypothetical protein [Deltaproteobacteria bacterium]